MIDIHVQPCFLTEVWTQGISVKMSFNNNNNYCDSITNLAVSKLRIFFLDFVLLITADNKYSTLTGVENKKDQGVTMIIFMLQGCSMYS